MRPLAGIAVSLFFSTAALAANISVVGLFPGKAVLVVDGTAPKTYAVGATVTDDARLIAVDGSSATMDVGGKRQTIAIGEHFNHRAPAAGASVTLRANGQGHFVTQGQINGGTVRMLVDTGATMIALPAADALRLGIDYKRGKPGYAHTANGAVPVYVVKLDSVKIGDVELTQVDAVVQDSGLPLVLLGMSFLNRTEMRRAGDSMTLTKRY